MKNQWYKNAVIYQIWPRSFSDGNGDGIGDLWGVYDKLEYIHDLGATAIWFSPLYVSPQNDYGYDIADYQAINPDYGDMDIFRKVLQRSHQLGMKVIMDLVINHTSDQHPWFIASKDPNSKYRDYYYWRDKPNNWDSVFGGSAWDYDEKAKAYYLHLFTKEQPDLNMDNPQVRAEIEKIMRFWLDLGVDGFREDVINCISKVAGLPNDILPVARGMKYFVNGPHLYEYLAQFKKVRDEYDAFAVGEGMMLQPAAALDMVSEGPNQLLDMMFNFQHMEADCMFTEYYPLPFSLRKLKKAFSNWQKLLYGKGWNALYLENHDHPRVISRYGSEKYHDASGKMLAACYLFLQGTPYIYQGQEIGMTNIKMNRIEDYPDPATLSRYRDIAKLWGSKKAFKITQRATRDSSRSPMQWNRQTNAGFTSGKPWLGVNPNYPLYNVETEAADPNSLYNFYKKAIAFRQSLPVVENGSYQEYNHQNPHVYFYSRQDDKTTLLFIGSFTDGSPFIKAPAGFNLANGEVILANYPENEVVDNGFVGRPYEFRLYRFEK